MSRVVVLKMMMSVRHTARALLSTLTDFLIHILSFAVFLVFDLVDQLLCPLFSYLDLLLDQRESFCYCHDDSTNSQTDREKGMVFSCSGAALITDCEFWDGHSNTLYGRKHKHGRKRVHFLTIHRTLSVDTVQPSKQMLARSTGPILRKSMIHDSDLAIGKALLLTVEKTGCLETSVSQPQGSIGKGIIQRDSPESHPIGVRWSDCCCSTCTQWHTNRDSLFVRVDGKVAAKAVDEDDAENNVIFIHGFLSSSSFWTETVFPVLSDKIKSTHRLFAVDVLGFGKSPKPTNCSYSNADHVDMIRKSVIDRYNLKKYHLVAHSMGCTIALSLAGQDPAAVRSVTLMSPPYYPAIPGSQPSSDLLWKVAPRRIWPVFALGPSIMSWYEHLGRVVCLVVTKNHRFWEPVLVFTCNTILRWRIPLFFFHDFMQHTHNSAWHIFHNTICSGAYTTEWSMTILQKAGKRVKIIHGDKDNICPLQCSLHFIQNYSNVSLCVVPGANHISILLGREKAIAKQLEQEFLSY